MSQAPPEIEALIWSIAESGDPQAVSEFETRFPEHRLELLRRVNAVQELRKAKGRVPSQARVFVPSPPRAPFARLGRFGFGAVALSGVAFASYWISTNYFSGAPSAGQSPPSVADRSGHIRHSQAAEVGEPMHPVNRESTENGTPLPTNPSPIPPTRLPTPSERPLTLHIERADLQTVLDGLAEQAGWQLEMAPGTPNPEVRVDYDNVPAIQILQDMGRRFGFTPFDEGNHKILIVPARDGSGPYQVSPKNPDGSPGPDGRDDSHGTLPAPQNP